MHITTALRPLLRPFENTGRSVAFLVAGGLVQLAPLLVLALPWLPGGPTEVLSVLLAVFVPLGVLIGATPLLTAVQRARFRGSARGGHTQAVCRGGRIAPGAGPAVAALGVEPGGRSRTTWWPGR
ncbi:hypothetical protein GCM10020000_55950 [Streptomyces olivoverticillatus]